ncbi:hypothetical protein FB004_10356 [Sinorhizobium medicae]|nr:hypothetical protein FB004_10356 [Sinorhizobium medicae]
MRTQRGDAKGSGQVVEEAVHYGSETFERGPRLAAMLDGFLFRSDKQFGYRFSHGWFPLKQSYRLIGPLVASTTANPLAGPVAVLARCSSEICD